MGEIYTELMDEEVKETSFTCGNESIDRKIYNSYYSTLLQQTYAYKIIIKDLICGYYLYHFQVIEADTSEKICGDEFNGGIYNEYMSLHIEYLAIEKDKQHNKIGKTVLLGIIKQTMELVEQYPIRAITLEAVDEYHDWYKKLGFIDIYDESENGLWLMYYDCLKKNNIRKINELYEM